MGPNQIFKMATCSVINCTNSYRKGYVLVRFPKDICRQEMWKRAMGRLDSNTTHDSRVCEVHFKEECWNEEFPNLLKSDAVPSRFCNCAVSVSLSRAGARKPLASLDVNVSRMFNDHVYSSQKMDPNGHDVSCPLYGVAEPRRKSIPRPPKPIPTPREPLPAKQPPKVSSQQERALQKENRKLKTMIANLSEKCKKTDSVAKAVTEELKREESWWKGRFGADQIAAAKSGTSRGRKWTNESIVKALKVRCTSGSSGLKNASQLLFPLPSERTLQRRTKNIKFQPGVLHQVLDAFGEEIKDFHEDDRDCLILFDDMAIKAKTDFDHGTKSYVGNATLPNVDAIATKAGVYVFAGVRRKFKVTGAYLFLPNFGCPNEEADLLLELLEKGQQIKLNVLGFVCDMGKRATLKKLGFRFCKDNMTNWIPHPFDPSKKLFCFPDMVHLFKSLKEVWCKNSTIELPNEIVTRFNLPSNLVKFEHVKFLSDRQEDEDLKFVPKLNTKELEDNHFRKMNLPNARCIMDNKVGAALDFLVYCGEAPAECSTTAWFVQIMNRWFQVVTSRTLSCGLSKHNEAAYLKAIEDLKLVAELMKKVTIGGQWKVVQTHIIVATESVLAIQEILLAKPGYKFLLLGRFLQDLVENIFSMIRAIFPIPSAVEFKYSLKRVVLSQFFFHNKKSSYEADDREEAVGLEQLLRLADQPAVKEDVIVQLSSWQEPPGVGLLSEESLLYRQCGYTVKSLMKKKMLKCKTCRSALKHSGPEPHPLSMFVKMTNFAEGAQIEVSDAVFQLLRRIEFNLRRWKKELKAIPFSAAEQVMKHFPKEILLQKISPCHPLTYRFLYAFVNARLKQFTVQFNKGQAQLPPSSLASRTMGQKFLAENLKSSTAKKKQLATGAEEPPKRRKTVPTAQKDESSSTGAGKPPNWKSSAPEVQNGKPGSREAERPPKRRKPVPEVFKELLPSAPCTNQAQPSEPVASDVVISIVDGTQQKRRKAVPTALGRRLLL